MRLLNKLFPHYRISNIGLYYVLSFLSEFYFITGNWIFFWIRYMTYGELGFLDMVAFSFGFLMEVPAGAIADRIGRKRSIALAFLCTSTGFLTMGTSTGQPQLIAGFFLAQIGWAFYSGAAEALAYDSLKEEGKEAHFEDVITTNHMVGRIATLIGAIGGGLLYTVHFRLPHLLTGIAFAVAFFVAQFVREPKIDSEHFSIKEYMKHIKEGFRQLLLPSIKPFIPLILVTNGVAFLYGAGIIQPAIAQKFGFDAPAFSFFSAISLAIGAFCMRAVPWLRTHLTDTQGMYMIALVLAVGFAGVALPYGMVVGAGVMLVISLIRSLTFPWTSIVVNRELESKYRATTLSAIEMIKKLPYITTAAITGSLIDANLLPQLSLVISGCIVAVVVLHMVLSKPKRL